MADDRTFIYNADLQGLQGDAIIDLMILDLEPIGATGANRFVRFVNWVVADGQPVEYGNEVYTAIPFKTGGFNLQTDGVPPNPTLTISNIGLEFTGLVNEWNDLIGARLTRRRVLARHLDSGINPDANAHWPDEVWVVQQKESEQKLLVTFKLSTAFDLDGVTLPRRRALRYTCPWIYRGEGCGYTGPPVADAEDNPLSTSDDPLLQAVIDTRALIPPARADFQAAEAAYGNAQADTANRQGAYDNAVNTRNNYSPYWTHQETRYHLYAAYVGQYSENNGTARTEAKWGDRFVSLGDEYRQGRRRGEVSKTIRNTGSRYSYTVKMSVFEIEQWRYVNDTSSLNAAVASAQTALTNAQTAEAAAKTVYDAELADYNTAIANYDAAVAAYQAAPRPGPDPADVCGKRLSSCRLRYFDPITSTYSDLPYGGFPGLTT